MKTGEKCHLIPTDVFATVASKLLLTSPQCHKEILNFLSKSQEKVCGRFKTEQVQKNNNTLHAYLSNLYSTAYHKIKNRALKYSALLIVGGLMIITGCNPKKTKTMGATVIEPSKKDSICNTQIKNDSSKGKENELMGEVAPPTNMKHEVHSTNAAEPQKTHTIGKPAMHNSSSNMVTPYPDKKIKKKIKGGDL